tara:strand:+ start:1511 stop:2128 length:618 start_codon:yes stop_codon:yes gene_type:complete
VKYIQEAALIPDAALLEAGESPFNRAGQWAKGKFVYGDERSGEQQGMLGKASEWINPAQYQAGKQEFQAKQASNFIWNKVFPSIKEYEDKGETGVPASVILGVIKNLNATPDETYDTVAGNLPTLVSLETKGEEPLDENQVRLLVQNLGFETVRHFAGEYSGKTVSDIKQPPEDVVRELQTVPFTNEDHAKIMSRAFHKIYGGGA